MIKQTGMEFIRIQMEQNMKAIGRMTSKLEAVLNIGPMAATTQESI